MQPSWKHVHLCALTQTWINVRYLTIISFEISYVTEQFWQVVYALHVLYEICLYKYRSWSYTYQHKVSQEEGQKGMRMPNFTTFLSVFSFPYQCVHNVVVRNDIRNIPF